MRFKEIIRNRKNMSDIPELDRLIEENENFRCNIKWRRRDRSFKIFMLLMILLFPIYFFNIFVFGVEVASILMVVYFILSLLPFVCECFFDIIEDVLKDDWKSRDMTKRYMRK